MKTNLSLKAMKEIDKSAMLDLLLDFPSQLKAAQGIGNTAKITFDQREFRGIVFAGLGGSAIGADLVRSYLYFDMKMPVNVYREYDLPAYIGSSTLVFLSSYSGNTEETLSAYAQAKEKGAFLIVISSGGKLKELALKDEVTFVQLPPGLPPRCALGYLSIIPLCILAKLGLAVDPGPAVNQTIRVLEELKKERLNPAVGAKDNIAKLIASKLVNKFTVIYSASVNFDVAATRLKGQLNENSKALALAHVFPEMNHNEVVGWQNPKKLFKDFVVLMLRDKKMHPRVAKRMEITKDILKEEGVCVIEIWSCEEGLLSRIFSLIYIGDFISYYLAIAYGIDPTPVERVTYLKEQLKKNNQ